MIGHYSQLAHQGISDPSRSMANGGSGGGGSSNPDTRYSNLDALYGTQNQASQFMLDNAQPKIPGLMKNSQSMVDDAMNGTLASAMRNRSSYDANEAISSANNDAIRNLTKYGAVGDPSGGRYADVINNNARNASATRVGAMNKANQFAEDQKWNRNANFYGQVMGMNSGAMQGMSSAGAGMGAIAGQQTANDQRNAAGYGQAGAAFGSALMKANGGYIYGKKPVRLADGGDAWAAYKAANPVKPIGSSSRSRTNPYMAMLSGAAPSLAGGALKDIFKGDKSSVLKAGKSALEYGKYGKEFLNGAQSLDQAKEFASAAQASLDAGYTGAEALGVVQAGSDAYDAANAAQSAADAVEFADTASAAADAASAASTASDTVSTGADIFSTLLNGAASGGYIKNGKVQRSGLKLAMGGMANASVASSNKIDNTTGVAQMDASNAMLVNKMDQVAQNKAETRAKPVIDTQYSGKTTGNFETSDGDPDGFGSQSADKRHLVGKSVMSYYIPGGGLLAEVVHPIAEKATRNAISLGDKLGRATLGGSDAAGFAGAFGLDPVGTIMSGKYFAEGGRVDHTDGGKVAGPGTETSDDIPAWLSDGEYVLNAEAVKLVGKDNLEEINNAGLEKRKAGALGMACGGAVKHGVKMAGGGFLGGNLGVAMGAGVDEWNRQRANDRADKAEVRADAADVRAVNSDNRQQALHGAQMEEIDRRNAEQKAVMAVWKDAQPVFQGGADAAAQSLLEKYNANDAALGYNDGHTANLTKTDKGYVVTRIAPDGKVVDERTFTPQQAMQEHIRGVYSRLASINPVYGEKLMGFLDNKNKEDTRKAERGEDISHRDKREGVQDSQWQQNFGLLKQRVANSGFGNALAQQRLNMEKESFQAEAGSRQLKSTLSTLNLALLNAQTPEERKPIIEKINSLESVSGQNKDAPSEVKLASALVKSGMAPDMKSGLRIAITRKGASPDEDHRDFVAANIKNGLPADKAVAKANEVMKNMGYTKNGASWAHGDGAPVGGPLMPPPMDKRVPGKTEFDHPTQGRVLWVEEGGKMGWKSVGK